MALHVHLTPQPIFICYEELIMKKTLISAVALTLATLFAGASFAAGTAAPAAAPAAATTTAPAADKKADEKKVEKKKVTTEAGKDAAAK